MSPDGTVVSEHLWKRFRADRTRALARDHYVRLRAQIRGEDVGWRWALRDVDFQVEPGESVGLVGSNGSGKSTLLKILTGVMYPYAGRLEVAGRVGALIEVRAGVHPDLTGRENTYLFGSLLGLSRADVARRFDDIVAFAELEDAIDRQVKFFSSGMQMRLGFAVAAFLEPDVLLVDEVLAVGDAAFQQKCLDRMRVVLAGGTTLVLVSHDLDAVEATCRRGIWLDRGAIVENGPIRSTLGAYRHHVEAEAEADAIGSDTDPLRLEGARCAGSDDGPVRSNEDLVVVVHVSTSEPVEGVVHLGVSEGTASPVFTVQVPIRLPAGDHEIGCSIPRLPLPGGSYSVWLGVIGTDGADLLGWRPGCTFDVLGPQLAPAPTAVVRRAPLLIGAGWTVDGDPLADEPR